MISKIYSPSERESGEYVDPGHCLDPPLIHWSPLTSTLRKERTKRNKRLDTNITEQNAFDSDKL